MRLHCEKRTHLEYKQNPIGMAMNQPLSIYADERDESKIIHEWSWKMKCICGNGVASPIYATLLGLGVEFDRFPRIAARPQSWAGGWNPIGIPGGCADIVKKECTLSISRIPLAWP